jgi:hypothetical protein
MEAAGPSGPRVRLGPHEARSALCPSRLTRRPRATWPTPMSRVFVWGGPLNRIYCIFDFQDMFFWRCAQRVDGSMAGERKEGVRRRGGQGRGEQPALGRLGSCGYAGVGLRLADEGVIVPGGRRGRLRQSSHRIAAAAASRSSCEPATAFGVGNKMTPAAGVGCEPGVLPGAVSRLQLPWVQLFLQSLLNPICIMMWYQVIYHWQSPG